MKPILVALLLGGVACGSKSSSTPSNTTPSTATAPADPLRADLETFCAPETAEKATSIDVLGPYVEPKLGDTEVKQAVLQLKGGDTASFESGIKAVMTKLDVKQCLTLERMMAPRAAQAQN